MIVQFFDHFAEGFHFLLDTGHGRLARFVLESNVALGRACVGVACGLSKHGEGDSCLESEADPTKSGGGRGAEDLTGALPFGAGKTW
jgi:hypothetical protein